MRFWNSFLKDARLQFRHGFYLIYGLVSLAYMGLLFALGPRARETMHSLFIYEDPSTLGHIFVGGMVLLERQERSLDTVWVTPLEVRDYLWAKVLSLNMLSIGTALLVTFPLKGFHFNIPLLIWSVALTAPIFTLIGLAVATRYQSLNALMLVTGMLVNISNWPLVQYFGLTQWGILEGFPCMASLRLTDMALGITAWDPLVWLKSTLILLTWLGLSYWWASHWFRKYLTARQGVKL